MTEQEIANKLFGTGTSGSATSQSLLSGVAVEASSGGQVKVQIDGAQIGIGEQDSVLLDTTCSVAAGQRVTITLFGRDGQGKKAFVSGVVGGSGGGSGGDIDELEQRMDAAESAITGLQSSDTSQNQRLNAAESNISSLQSTTTALGTRVTNAESAITGLQSTTSGLSTRMSTAESDIDALESTTSGLSTRLSDAEDDIDDIQSDLTAAQSTLTSLGTRMSTAEGNISSLQSTTSSLGTRLSTAEGDIDDLDDRVTALEQGGGSDPGLANRVTACENDIDALQTDMSTVQGDITALQTRLGTDESKINEVIGVINDFKWQRLYLWTLSGYSRASLWYRKATGEVLVAVNINGSMNSGWNWYNTGAALPADLRPTAFPTAALISARNTIWANPLILICSGDDGRVSAYMQNSGTSSEGGTISYLVQPGLNYSSTTWTGPDISQLSLTRALAARIALGDGLAEQQDLEKDEAAYNEAFDIIFGDEK